jgi:xanthine/CO dehydrogenase XdhC/CoxF family maturation factor
MTMHVEVIDLVAQLKAAEQPFALATVVRTVSVTAAKAGAKAVIRPDGTIVAGWIGGGCARGAVLKAAREALVDGQARMIAYRALKMCSGSWDFRDGDTAAETCILVSEISSVTFVLF